MAAKKKSKTVLILKTVAADLTSFHDSKFVYPQSGPVSAQKWDPTPSCGDGLHGLLWGVGDAGALLNTSDDATKWLIFEADAASVVEIDGKCKAPSGVVVHVGDSESALVYLDAHGAADKAVVWAQRTAGYSGTATAGDSGTATAGDRGTATAGNWGTATAGDRGTATAGNWGTATAGYWGTATAGYSGTATAGDSGTATAGYSGTIAIRWDDRSRNRYRTEIGYVGENGIEPNVAYKLDGNHKFVKAIR